MVGLSELVSSVCLTLVTNNGKKDIDERFPRTIWYIMLLIMLSMVHCNQAFIDDEITGVF